MRAAAQARHRLRQGLGSELVAQLPALAVGFIAEEALAYGMIDAVLESRSQFPLSRAS